MRKTLLVILALMLVFPATSALAQRGGGGHGGGGSRGGGSHGGGSHGGAFHGGSFHGGGFHGGGGYRGGGHHGGYRHGYRGYYGGYYGAYAFPYWGWGWGWGWGWAPYYYGAYYYGRGAYGGPSDWTVVDTDVSPEEARVYLDGRYIGIADDFDGFPDFLYLRPGRYAVEFRLDGYESQSVTIDSRPGKRVELNNKLKKIPGAARHGSYDTPRPEGGVLRFWGKQRGVDVPYDSDGPPPPRYDGNDVEARPDGDAPAPPPATQPRGDSWRQAPPDPVRPKQARLRFLVQPGDAAVYLDDRFLGIAQEIDSLERGVPLAPGKHTVMVSRPGFRDQTVEIDVAAGESKEIEISLAR